MKCNQVYRTIIKVALKKWLVLFIVFFVSQGISRAQPTVEDPNPKRFQQEIKAFAEWDAKNSFPEDAILFVGSSSIRFWKSHKAFPDYPIINRGFGGSHISDIQHYYKQVIGKYSPSVIIFYAGDNDVAAGKSAEQVMADYKMLAGRILRDFPDSKFVYIPIKPSSSRWKYWPSMQELNQQIKSYNEQNNHLHYIDLATPLLNSNGKPDDTLFLDDQLHLNEDGYALWNRILQPELKKIYKP